jgi:hypothetical protein
MASINNEQLKGIALFHPIAKFESVTKFTLDHDVVGQIVIK